eukprot:Gb_25049 [translate_table: standard]
MFLQNVVHGDIKPENLLVNSNGRVKICDFSVSRMFEGNNDELRRSPGTPVFTAPECCLGLAYHGKVADVWALGVTLYCMVLGGYPFIGETLQDTYDKIVYDPLSLPEDMNPELANLLQGLLCKDPNKRMSLDAAARHPWVLKGPESFKNHSGTVRVVSQMQYGCLVTEGILGFLKTWVPYGTYAERHVLVGTKVAFDAWLGVLLDTFVGLIIKHPGWSSLKKGT